MAKIRYDMSRKIPNAESSLAPSASFTETSRATMQDAEDIAEAQTPKHDVALVASYLEMLTERSSTLPSYFLVDAERLAGQWAIPQLPIDDASPRPLSVVLKDLMISLRGSSENLDDLDILDTSNDNTFSMGARGTSRGQPIHQRGNGETKNAELEPKGDHVLPKRIGEDPLWAIADVLLGKVENLVTVAIKDRTLTEASELNRPKSRVVGLYACRTTEDGVSTRKYRSSVWNFTDATFYSLQRRCFGTSRVIEVGSRVAKVRTHTC